MSGSLNYKILLVDDEPDILDFLGYNLKKEGYTVLTASNGVEAIAKAKKELPHLIKTYEGSKEEIRTRTYRGKEGMKALYEDFLNYKHNYFIGANFAIKKYMGNFWTRWNEKRQERKVFWHDILPKKTYDINLPSYYKKEKLKYYEYKVLPPEFEGPHFIAIYGSNVANLLWNEPMFAFVIESEQVAKNYHNYFKFLWKRLPDSKG